jgi:Ca2+-binding EF-hand superfamily protein
MLKAFRLFDPENTGLITFESLKRVAMELGEDLTDEELKEMIAEADTEGKNAVDQEEFIRIMKKATKY